MSSRETLADPKSHTVFALYRRLRCSAPAAPLEPRALAYDKPLCASLDGFTLHAATRAGALDSAGREALLRYVLRPLVAQERVEQRADGLVCASR